MKFSGRNSKRISVICLIAICAAGLITLIFLNETLIRDKYDTLQNIKYASLGDCIQVSWDTGRNTRIDSVSVTVADSDGQLIREDQAPASEGSFYFDEGIHGQLYVFSVIAHHSDGTDCPEETGTAMFLDQDSMPDIPLLIINTDSGEDPTYEEATYDGAAFGESIKSNDYEDASISIPGSDIIEDAFDVKIRIRGNTSSVLYDKKSYKLHFEEAADLLDMGDDLAVHDWCLLNNATNIRTFLGYCVASECGLEWQLHMKYVNLILNGDYKGCYILTEAVNKESSHGLVSDSGYIFENDVYWWNSDGMYFRTTDQPDAMAYTFKYPDMSKRTDYRIFRLNDYMEAFDQALTSGSGSYSDYIDIESFASWILARDILSNSDGGGSNMYFYKYDYDENAPTSTKVKMGPLWDFDMIFENYDQWSSSRDDDVFFFEQLLAQPDFYNVYCEKWSAINDSLCSDLDDMIDALIAEDGQAVNESWQLDSNRWNEEYVSLEDRRQGADDWFSDRVIWMNEQLGVN